MRTWVIKRRFLPGLVVILVVVGCAIVGLRERTESSDPRFVVFDTGVKIPSHSFFHYDYLGPKIFRNGKVWVSLYSTGKTYRAILYDIERKAPTGELLNGWPPGLMSEDGSKVLVTVDRVSPKLRFFKMVETITGKKIGNQFREEHFALLDLKNNKSTYLGTFQQHAGAGSSWIPSPTSRFAFNRPTSETGKSIHLLDLQKATMERVNLSGYALGWWDDTQILFSTPGQDYELLNVTTRERTSLVTSNAVAAFLQQQNVADPFEATDAFFSGPGWFITGQRKRWLAASSFLLKLEHPSGTLSLVSTNFKFEWSDSFDKTGRYYLYSGRESGQQSSAVFLRDLKSDTTTTLVADDGAQKFSIPRWYGDNIIYTRSQMLWQVSILNTNPVQVFPPPQ